MKSTTSWVREITRQVRWLNFTTGKTWNKKQHLHKVYKLKKSTMYLINVLIVYLNFFLLFLTFSLEFKLNWKQFHFSLNEDNYSSVINWKDSKLQLALKKFRWDWSRVHQLATTDCRQLWMFDNVYRFDFFSCEIEVL
jgi:hypothetical protein